MIPSWCVCFTHAPSVSELFGPIYHFQIRAILMSQNEGFPKMPHFSRTLMEFLFLHFETPAPSVPFSISMCVPNNSDTTSRWDHFLKAYS